MKNIELTHPTVMSASARAAEITAILAAAIIRTQLAQAEKPRAVDLGFLPASAFIHRRNGHARNESLGRRPGGRAPEPAHQTVLYLWDWHFPRRPENPNRNYLEPRIAYKLQEDAFLDLAA